MDDNSDDSSDDSSLDESDDSSDEGEKEKKSAEGDDNDETVPMKTDQNGSNDSG